MTHQLITITLLSYVALLLFVAWYSSRRASNLEYFVAGRRIRWYMAVMVMITSAMSGITFISVAGAVARDSFSYLQMTLGFAVGQGVIAFVIIPLLYRLKVTSIYEYLSDRFGEVTHKSGAWIFLLSKSGIVALRIYVMCVVMQGLLFGAVGVPFWCNVVCTVFVVWLATLRGGMRTLVSIESLKSISLIGALVLTIVYICQSFGWTLGQGVAEIFRDPSSRIFFFDDAQSPYYFWKMFLAGVFSIIAMTGLDHDMMQCNMSCVNRRHAQVNIMVTAVSQIFVILLFLMLGVLLYIYAQANSIPLPERGDELFARVAVGGGLPVFVGVLFIWGLSATTLTSACSSLTALTTSFTVDILHGQSRYDEQRLTRVRRGVHTVLALFIVVLILLVGGVGDQSVINTLFKFVGYAYAPILAMFTFGIFTRRRIHDKLLPLVVIVSLGIGCTIEWGVAYLWGYKIGFEMLMYNAALAIVGMFLISKR